MQIDRNAHIPLYIQLKGLIEDKIRSKEWEIGSLIPSEIELQKQLNVSRITVRQALNELATDGLVSKRQGMGTYVALPKLSHNLPILTSFTEDIISKGFRAESKLLNMERVKNAAVSKILDIDPDTVLLNIKRLRLINGEEAGIHDCYVNTTIFDKGIMVDYVDSGVLLAMLDNGRSLFDILEKECHIEISHADETLEGGSADKQMSKLLHIKEGFPLLILDRITFTPRGVPIEYVKMYNRADKYKYSITLKRH